jgi:hypothetical protein
METRHNSKAFGPALRPVGRCNGVITLAFVVVIVTVVLPLPVTEGGVKLQELSVGRLEHENVTVPLKPFVAFTERDVVPMPPGLAMVIEEALNARLKFGEVESAPQLFTKLAASTDPKPVAKSYPGPALYPVKIP